MLREVILSNYPPYRFYIHKHGLGPTNWCCVLDAPKKLIYVSENPLEKVQIYKYLGIWLDVNLDWHYFIEVVRSKSSRRIGVLKRVRSYLTEDLTTKLHNAMVLPLFDYYDTIYGPTDHLALSKLRLQNRGAKTILRAPNDTPTQIVLTYLKWLPLTKCITYHTHIQTISAEIINILIIVITLDIKINRCYMLVKRNETSQRVH